jgi:hypothetical protein
MNDSLITLFHRDLDKLANEINAYDDVDQLWKTTGEIKNSGGNLCLHLAGNLRHFIGHIIGKTEYMRDREAEFASKNVVIREMLAEIQLTKEDIKNTLENLSPTQLQENYPLELFGHPMTVEFFIIHLYGHLNWHLGQINYHRRLIQSTS